ncbi:MAG: hypothetical protein DRJ14_03850 [Acidobacteria bacterium]|nr:MAG: hypothetical protein DRJ14_03850 [Acidobacteriota bacterium]
MIKNAQEILDGARRQSGNKTVAVAMANDASVLQAVVEAEQEGLVHAILVGDVAEMREIAGDGGFSLDEMELVNEKDPVQGCKRAVELAAEGKAQFLMKGFVKTAVLLKALLAKPELKSREVMSHVAVLSIPGRDRLLFFTDGGMIPKPDTAQKEAICRNMADLAKALEISPFRFGFLAPYADEASPEHEDICKRLKDLGPDFHPMSAVTPEFAFENLDGLVATAIEECNTITKGLTLHTDTIFSGLIMGTRVPVCLVSRSDSAINKKASLALGVLFAGGGEK